MMTDSATPTPAPPHKGEGFPAWFASLSGKIAGQRASPGRTRLWAVTALVALAALAVVLLAGWLASSWLDLGAAPPPKNPFGVGVREGGAPAGGIAGWILATQGEFYRQLTAAVRALAADGSAAWTLASLSFAYGVFHAAGPGHGKAVISAWILANERMLWRGLAMAIAAALLQAVVAAVLVSVLAGLIGVTARGMTETVSAVETASFAAVALVGAVLLWTKARRFALRWVPQAGHAHAPGEACGPDCLHAHMPAPIADNSFSWRAAASAGFAAGVRPCSGAIIVLVFAMAQGVFAAGVAAAFAMALGVALTTGALAALSVFAKGAALRLASGRGEAGARLVSALEVLAAAVVFAFGAALLAGLWSVGPPG